MRPRPWYWFRKSPKQVGRQRPSTPQQRISWKCGPRARTSPASSRWLACQTIALLMVFVILAQVVALAQSAIRSGAAVYIEPIDDLLDKHLLSELTRQQVALKVVASREEADVLIVGADQKKNLKLTPQGGGAITFACGETRPSWFRTKPPDPDCGPVSGRSAHSRRRTFRRPRPVLWGS